MKHLNTIRKRLLSAVFTLLFSGVFAQVPLIPVGHSHNDYTRKQPLHDALENGFMSVEADVFYRKRKFLVAHTVLGIRKKKTLEQLYLKPMLAVAKKNNGKLYENAPTEFELMIDTKGNWTVEQLREMEQHLMQYAQLFTIYNNSKPERKAAKVVLSGGGYAKVIANDNPRLFSVDAGMGEINSPLDSNIICRNSAPYKSYFSWKGKGEMPAEEKKVLQQLCNDARYQNRKLHFWACPQNENVWREMINAGVGWINVDDLKKFRKFYWEEYKQN